MEKTDFRFNLRVYGIIYNEKNQILVTDEFHFDTSMTKFPGGGLDFGEGTIDCLRREIGEECNGQQIKNIRHFYTTEFYQKTIFYENQQLISIYYLAELEEPIRFTIAHQPFYFCEMKNGNQSFRWVEIKSLNPDEFTFPVDKFVVRLLKEKGI